MANDYGGLYNPLGFNEQDAAKQREEEIKRQLTKQFSEMPQLKKPEMQTAWQMQQAQQEQAPISPASEGLKDNSASIMANTGKAAATGAMAGGPWGAAIMAGGTLASQIMAQKAADERARRDREAQIAEQQAKGQRDAWASIMDSYGKALR